MVAVSERSHHVEVSIVHNNDEMIIGTSDKYVMHLAVQSKSLSYTPSDTEIILCCKVHVAVVVSWDILLLQISQLLRSFCSCW
jgi:hypothetical protein